MVPRCFYTHVVTSLDYMLGDSTLWVSLKACNRPDLDGLAQARLLAIGQSPTTISTKFLGLILKGQYPEEEKSGSVTLRPSRNQSSDR